VALQLVGAGLGRTGTHSLKNALELLLGGRCYHMVEVFGRPDDPVVWDQAIAGHPPDWDAFFGDFVAAVDWPAAACWREIADAFPDAPVLLSVREADSWWKSASSTIFEVTRQMLDGGPPTDVPADGPGMSPEWIRMTTNMLAAFCPDWRDEEAAKAAYLAHNDAVRAVVAPDRLVEWHPGDGWEPICRALGLDVPTEPFPHVNTTAEFRAMSDLPAL
jgi:hypothetical protein